MPEMSEIIKAVLETEVDAEKQLGEILAKMEVSDKGKAAASAAVRLLSAFKDEMPEGLVAKLAVLAGVTKEEPSKPPKKEDDEEDDDDKKPPFLKSADGAGGSEGEGMSEEIRKELESRDKALEVMQKQNESMVAEIKKERDARELAAWVAKAREELAHYPGKSAEEMGQMLKTLHDADPKIASDQFDTMKSASEALKESTLLKSAGGVGAPASGSSYDKIEKMAANLIEKSDTQLTRPQAIAKVLDMNPELYEAYLGENPKQTEA